MVDLVLKPGPTLPALYGLYVLIVEDAADLAFTMQSLFLRHGALGVDLRVSADAARERMRTTPYPDIVLLDYRLRARPGGEQTSGLDVALWMREQDHLRLHGTKRVLFSGIASDIVDVALRDVANPPGDPVFHLVAQKGEVGVREIVALLADLR
jgi:CheY-like chemotaxis protein